MRLSRLPFQTRRESPADLNLISDQLLVKAGYARPDEDGQYALLPLAVKSLANITKIIQGELEKTGSFEICLPFLQGSQNNQNSVELAYPVSNPMPAARLASAEIRSYRKLPVILHHLQVSEPGISNINKRLALTLEQKAIECFGFSLKQEDLDQTVKEIQNGFLQTLLALDLPVIQLTGAPFAFSPQNPINYIYPSPCGPLTYLSCPACGYSALEPLAVIFKDFNPGRQMLPIEKVSTPGVKTIKALAEFLHISASETAKAVFLVARVPGANHQVEEKFVFAVVRGDMDVNEIKLTRLLKAISLRPATDEEIRAVGAIPGYASPVGLKEILTVVDNCIPRSPNLVAGANEEGYHLRNVNFGRDYNSDLVADIALARDGDLCPNCKSALNAGRGILVGNIEYLGESQEATCLDENGTKQPLRMVSGRINPGRLLSCIIEEHHDEFGLVLPVSAAPFPVSLVVLEDKNGLVKPVADMLEKQFSDLGIDLLVDDRQDSPGVKFMDADLIGIPLRLTISERSLQNGGVEFKRRIERDRQVIPVENVLYLVQEELTKANEPRAGYQPGSRRRS
jgi:prolyl-tRNA synthetase